MSDPRYVANKIEGKTIQKLVRSYDDQLLLFTDGTYTKFVVEPGYEGDTEVSFDELTMYELLQLGVITDHEFEAAQESAMVEQLKQEQEARRVQYERLKAEFEGGS